MLWPRFVPLAAGGVALGWLAGWALSEGRDEAVGDADGWAPGRDGAG